jgi:UDP-N-acetylmuramate: L-alanyl-gamma-D-glutamyl-meso-diaminopimelate ligase
MQKIHFIGICGKGMSAVAKLCKDLGYTISGSDEGFYPPISTYIEKNNIPFEKGYRKENIKEDVDVVVISKHAKLIPEENEEVAYAFSLQAEGKLKIKSFPELLNQITKDRENIAVAGSYGKSTCTSLLSWILEKGGVDVGYFIGASPTTPNTNAKIGIHKNFILEGDEYPSANWDSKSKFLHYNAHDLLLTSLTHDHVNIFKTLEDYQAPFFDLIKSLPSDGNLILCLDNKEILEKKEFIKNNTKAKIITYSLENSEADYFAKNISFAEKTTFDLYKSNGVVLIEKIETELLGKHNLQNIVGVISLILEKNLLSIERIKIGVKSFQAVEGRLNELKNVSKIRIFEGFGSSYDKARSAIEAINLHFPNKKMIIIFEPHTFSWRNKEAVNWYDNVFAEAEKVFVYNPPAHGATTHAQLSQDEIIDRIQNSEKFKLKKENVFKITEKENGVKNILENVDENSIILILTSGDLGGIIPELLEKIKFLN